MKCKRFERMVHNILYKPGAYPRYVKCNERVPTMVPQNIQCATYLTCNSLPTTQTYTEIIGECPDIKDCWELRQYYDNQPPGPLLDEYNYKRAIHKYEIQNRDSLAKLSNQLLYKILNKLQLIPGNKSTEELKARNASIAERESKFARAKRFFSP